MILRLAVIQKGIILHLHYFKTILVPLALAYSWNSQKLKQIQDFFKNQPFIETQIGQRIWKHHQKLHYLLWKTWKFVTYNGWIISIIMIFYRNLIGDRALWGVKWPWQQSPISAMSTFFISPWGPNIAGIFMNQWWIPNSRYNDGCLKKQCKNESKFNNSQEPRIIKKLKFYSSFLIFFQKPDSWPIFSFLRHFYKKSIPRVPPLVFFNFFFENFWPPIFIFL